MTVNLYGLCSVSPSCGQRSGEREKRLEGCRGEVRGMAKDEDVVGMSG